MATSQTIIDRALRLIGVIASGESPTASESADALIALNGLIESWQTEKLLVYTLTDTAFTLVASDASYTVGPAGNFALTPRPNKLEDVFVRASGVDYPVKLVESERWFAIPDKTETSDLPSLAYYEPTLSTGTLLLWPVPNTAHSLHIVTSAVLSSLAALGTTIALPQGYERALAYNLAIDIAPEYGAPVSASVASTAVDSLASIKRANQRSMLAYTELGQMMGRRADIYSDGQVA